MLDVRYSHLYFYQSLNRLQRGLSAIAELLVTYFCTNLVAMATSLEILYIIFEFAGPKKPYYLCDKWIFVQFWLIFV